MKLFRLSATLLLLAGWGVLSVRAAQAEGAAPTAATPGVFDGHIVLGQSAAFSGTLAELAREYRRGASIYFDWVNLRGGVHGRSVFLTSMDDGYEPERALENTKRLLESDKVFALFGSLGTANCAAVMPLVAEHRVPFFAPYTGAEQFRTPVNPHVFNVRPGYYQETEALVEHVTKQGKKSIAVFYQDDGFGKGGLEGVQQALKRRNLTIGASGTFPRNTLDVAAAVSAIRAGKPDAVVMAATYGPAAEFLRQAKALEFKPIFLALSVIGSKSFVADAWLDSADVVISQTVPFPDDEDFPITDELDEATDTLYGKGVMATYTELEGFLAAKIFVQGLEDAGRDLTREKFMAALESYNDRDFGGIRIGWSKNSHQGAAVTDLFVIGENKGTGEGSLWFY